MAMHRAGELPDCTGDAAELGKSFKTWSKAVGEVLGRKGKGLFMPLRVALTGRSSGPDLPAQLQLLALAPGAVSDGVVVVGLEARMTELEQVLGTLPVPDATAEEQPAKAAA